MVKKTTVKPISFNSDVLRGIDEICSKNMIKRSTFVNTIMNNSLQVNNCGCYSDGGPQSYSHDQPGISLTSSHASFSSGKPMEYNVDRKKRKRDDDNGEN